MAYQNLKTAVKEFRTYPKNLQRSQVFRFGLEAYHDRLKEAKDRLFDSDPEYFLVELLETNEKKQDRGHSVEFFSTRCTSLADLKTCLEADHGSGDPRCRHIFFESDHSRAPLDCSSDMFTYVMTHHQVMAPFLDLALAFGRQKVREDFYYTAFRHENYFDPVEGKRFAIPQLGRSGVEYRQCYNLFAVERSDAGGPSWSIRQTAVYHCFDMENGSALWVNISPHSEIKRRITSAACTHRDPSLQPGSRSEENGDMEVVKSFASTLATHLVLIEWSAEHWRSYINSLETATRETLGLVNNVPLQEIEQDSEVLLKSLVVRNLNEARSSAISLSEETPASSSRSRRPLSGITVVGREREQQLPWQKSQMSAERENMDPFAALHGLSFVSLQRLNATRADLHRANLVMKLNQDILTEQIKYYQALLDNDELPLPFKAGCRVHVDEFVRRVGVLARLFAMEQARVTTLLQLLSDGRDLLDKILQFRNIQISTRFSVHAHDSAARMEELTREMHRSTESMHQIAAKTERETSSMHIITLVNLIFLPGTFVATFLGSGLFRWDENDPSQPVPEFRPRFFALFAQICFPLMGITGLIWLVANSWSRWKWKVLPKAFGRGELGGSRLEEDGLDHRID
ncbi:hypothetical protein V8F20_006138 [Naviculisporaceae sp. PSN 640]